MREFNNGFNTVKYLLDHYTIVAVQEHWLKSDNLSNFDIVDDDISFLVYVA
jgi:hypothetical protein